MGHLSLNYWCSNPREWSDRFNFAEIVLYYCTSVYNKNGPLHVATHLIFYLGSLPYLCIILYLSTKNKTMAPHHVEGT